MTNKTEKMTNVKALDYVLANCELTDEVREKVANIRASYAKKSTTNGEKKPTANQVANEAIKTALYDEMEANTLYRIGDMLKTFTSLAGLSAPKVTALMTQLKDAGLVTRSEDKGKAFYCKVEG